MISFLEKSKKTIDNKTNVCYRINNKAPCGFLQFMLLFATQWSVLDHCVAFLCAKGRVFES